MHRPRAFIAVVLRLGWFPEGVFRELIQLIASYACTPCMLARTLCFRGD